MFGVNAFGWPYFGQGYAGQVSTRGPAPTDVFVLVRPDVENIAVQADVETIAVRPDVGSVDLE